MTISNTPNNPPSFPASLAAEPIEVEGASPPSALSLLILQMKEKLKNVPLWPMVITMVGAGLLGVAFISGTPFSFPLLISGAIVLGLGVAWFMSSQIAKGLGIGSSQDNDENTPRQVSAISDPNAAASSRRTSQTPSQISQTDSQARQSREDRNSRQAHTDRIRRLSLEQQEGQRRNNNQISSAHLGSDRRAAKLKAFEDKPKAKNETELPKAGRFNLAFDDFYDEDDFEDFYNEHTTNL